MKLNFTHFIVFLFAIVAVNATAQEIGEIKTKEDSFKSNKLGDGPKEVYIASFNINFEIYKEAVDKKKAGGFGRTIKSAAKAKAAIGISSLDKAAIQEKADLLYSEFVNDFKSKGYVIISSEQAGNTNTYKNFKKAVGPEMYETDMTGIVAVVPAGYSYYYKERTAFSSKFGGLDKTPQNLSKDLNDALVVDVSLVYVFSEVGTDWNLAEQAQVRIFVNYRLADSYMVSDEKTSSGGLTSFFDKSKQAVGLASTITFTRGKLSIGGSPEAQYVGSMKKDLEIDGVLKKEKVIAFSSQTQATATTLNPVVSIIGSNYSEKTKWLEPDGKKYAEGMYLAGKAFISKHLSEVFTKL